MRILLWFTPVLLLLLIFLWTIFKSKVANEDLITNLPGLNKNLSFNQYSGYLAGVSSDVMLHYWFVEATTNASRVPLVLWLNGGPGCSSLLGLLTENGPFTIEPNLKLSLNTFSWNLLANILYLEAPAGVGYSYAVDGNYKTDDDLVAANSRAAILHFLEKYPEYLGRDFYITGESYGGVYVPTLAIKLMETPLLKLRGIAVGNALLNYMLNDNSLIYFVYYHGLIGARLWDHLNKACCSPDTNKNRCYFSKSTNERCQSYISEVVAVISYGFNIYNLYSPCAGGVPPVNNSVVSTTQRNTNFDRRTADLGNLFLSPNSPFRRRLVIACSDDTDLTGYLNSDSVRKALHIPDCVGEWNTCSEEVYTTYIRLYSDLTPQYSTLLKHKIRVLIYNGDVDMACNFLGDEWFANDLNLTLTKPREEWFYIAADNTRQIGGFTKTFTSADSRTELKFLTVRGAGHMVPQDKPSQGYTLFRNFISNRD